MSFVTILRRQKIMAIAFESVDRLFRHQKKLTNLCRYRINGMYLYNGPVYNISLG